MNLIFALSSEWCDFRHKDRSTVQKLKIGPEWVNWPWLKILSENRLTAYCLKKGDSYIILLNMSRWKVSWNVKRFWKFLEGKLYDESGLLNIYYGSNALQDDLRRWWEIWTHCYYLGGSYNEWVFTWKPKNKY